jgi:hypothetical protein
MSTPPSQYDFLDLLDFSVEFGMDIDFGVDFGFGADFTTFDSASDDSGFYQYDGVSSEFSVDGYVWPPRHKRGPIDSIVFEA